MCKGGFMFNVLHRLKVLVCVDFFQCLILITKGHQPATSRPLRSNHLKLLFLSCIPKYHCHTPRLLEKAKQQWVVHHYKTITAHAYMLSEDFVLYIHTYTYKIKTYHSCLWLHCNLGDCTDVEDYYMATLTHYGTTTSLYLRITWCTQSVLHDCTCVLRDVQDYYVTVLAHYVMYEAITCCSQNNYSGVFAGGVHALDRRRSRNDLCRERTLDTKATHYVAGYNPPDYNSYNSVTFQGGEKSDDYVRPAGKTLRAHSICACAYACFYVSVCVCLPAYLFVSLFIWLCTV